MSLINVITVDSSTPETTAVSTRATSSVSYVGATMARRLPALNTARNVTNKGNLRKRPVESTMIGVDTAYEIAKKPTRLPAEAREIPYSSAISGVIPITMNSAKPRAKPTITNATVASFVRAEPSATKAVLLHKRPRKRSRTLNHAKPSMPILILSNSIKVQQKEQQET